MNKNLALFLAAVTAGLSVVGIVSARAQAKVSDPVMVSVSLHRATKCYGRVAYLVAPVDATLQGDLGAREIDLDVIVPCARVDAVDALLALPSTRSGTLAVQTQDASVFLQASGTCYADLNRTLTPVDADVAAVMGVKTVVQRVDPVACTRMAQALAGAVIKKGSEAIWPVSVIALPLPVEP